MKNLLIITQKVDENDNHRGFFIDWIREFAKNFSEVNIITVSKGIYTLPEKVHIYSLGKERGLSKFTQAIIFYWHLARFVPSSSGIFAYSSPIFVIASWPLTFLYRKKIILWYLHRSVTLKLKIAERLAYRIATAAKESLNLKSKKIVEIGHGININRFKNLESRTSSHELMILSIGRISRIRNFETLIKAMGILKSRGLNFKLKIVGQPVMPPDFKYFEDLKKLVGELNLNNQVEFIGFIPYGQTTEYYKKADILINPAPKGGIDKVVLEAMAMRCMVFVANPVFVPYLAGYEKYLLFEYGNAEDLADKVEDFLKLSSEKIKEMSESLEESVVKHHDLKKIISKISGMFT
ncbi:MAG: hypothetical protein A2915_03345 [Candidatus Yanofskybacteria bacterium RIFCSPLOWO2_01_FULL_41_34]|uniref:Glycosyl transferase family 1 domain-containing protein n=1 Tax=Candidatus Yanofskybacteria bacterium RIFCSPHIGHO2_01_FULL_41_26 TaxID=1802661 RepID=A0A1F8EDN3_9BACT|nr:MAG: hypothetical protein A2649_01240 [Candidatus Yanofskybacteria bacterium RIFCSPHIGHO2_01_FULL_41_26]OGN21066.1 MAG: hypothetical protein A2915_03345 [Candidatus Yanofskybacteria bacterium RIFCSPLOWO2_01_FULL_41_34]